MAHARVPRAAAVVALAPRDRMVVIRRVAVVLVVGGLVDRGEHVDAGRHAASSRCRRRRPRRPQAPGSCTTRPRAASGFGRPVRGVVIGVLDVDRRGRRSGRMVAEVRAHQLAVPGPRVLGVGRGVDAHVAAATLDVALERRLLGVVERVARGREEDHGVVVGQDGVVEDRGDPRTRRPGSGCPSPSFLIAAMPAGIESWRKPVVLEKTSTRKRSPAWSGPNT